MKSFTLWVIILMIINNHAFPQGELGDTRLWELLEQLNLRDLVAVGGLEAKVQQVDDADNYDSSSQPMMGYTVDDQDNDRIAIVILPTHK